MKKIAIIRFGTECLQNSEEPIYDKLVDHNMLRIVPMTFGNLGVLSLVYTDVNIPEIIKLFIKTSEDSRIPLPVIVFELNRDNCGIYLNHIPAFLNNFDTFNKNISKYNSLVDAEKLEERPISTLTLDDILDIVTTRGGVKFLTKPEKERLIELSKK